MAKRIVLFLSSIDPNKPLKEEEYICPDGGKAAGRIASEAPVLYLLRKHPDAQEVIAFLTEEAEKTAWGPFQQYVQGHCPAKLKFSGIPVDEDEDFCGAPLDGIWGKFKEKDEILLETTGGFRSAVMDLLLLSRLLAYNKIYTTDAVYSNRATHQIKDITHMIRMFDLLAGMQEMSAFGSVSTLKRYYGQQLADEGGSPLAQVLNSMESMSDQLTLCRTGQLMTTVEQLDRQLEDAAQENDPMLNLLLPVFRKKFSKRLTAPGMAKWCLENGRLNQALILYNEFIPVHILRRKNIGVKEWVEPEKQNYGSEEYGVFCAALDRLCGLAEEKKNLPARIPPEQYKNCRIKVLEILSASSNAQELLEADGSPFTVPRQLIPAFRNFLRDYWYFRTLRNMVSHGNDKEETDPAYVDYLCEQKGCVRPSELKPDEIRKMHEKSLEEIKRL